jgi:hypothetical protein
MDNWAAAPVTNAPVDHTVPAGISVPAKKGGKGAVVLAILFALIAAGLGVWLAILLLNPAKKDNCEVSKENGSNKETVVSERNEEEVLKLLDKIKDVAYPSEQYYSDSGLPIKVSSNLWAESVRSYGAKVTVYDDSGSDANQVRNSIVDILKDNGLKSTTVSNFGFGAEGENTTDYFENTSTGLYCYVGTPSEVEGSKYSSAYSWFTYDCTNKNWLTDENKQLAIDLASAYGNSEEGKEYKIKFIEGTLSRLIKKNAAGTYEHITVGFEDSVAIFYRKVGGDWKFFKSLQQGPFCDDFKTSELKEAFEGESCLKNDAEDYKGVVKK